MIKKIILCFMLMLVFAVPAVSAQDLPEFFYGDLYIDGEPAPIGTLVEAYIDEQKCGESFTTVLGEYGSGSNLLMVQLPEGYTGDMTITFKADSRSTSQNTQFESGETTRLDLYVGEMPDARLDVIPIGGDVFIGEEGLDVSAYLLAGDQIAWYSPTTDVHSSEPNAILTIDDPEDFYIDPIQFGDKTGNWYIWDGGNPTVAFVVQDPSINLRIWNQDEQEDIIDNGNQVPVGNYLNFRIETNLYSVISQRGGLVDDSSLGIINVIATSELTGTNYQTLRGKLDDVSGKDIPLRNQAVDSNPWYWPLNDYMDSGWNTGALDSSSDRLYPNGNYVVYAEVNLNNIKKNYRDASGEFYEGKTISTKRTATITDDIVTVGVNPGALTRTDSFYVTVGGRPDTEYIIVIMECPADMSTIQDCCALKLDGGPCERPPIIRQDQPGVLEGDIVFDSSSGPYSIGNTRLIPDCCEKLSLIRDVVPTDDKPNADDVIENGVRYYAKIKTDADSEANPGFRTIEFQTGPDIAPDMTYRIHVQSVDEYGGEITTGDSQVLVSKGTVTLVTEDDAPFYLGNDITLTGTNSDSDKVYLFMTGPCQNGCGNDLLSLKHADASEHIIMPLFDEECNCLEEGDEFTCIEVDVKSDGTWEYVWKTSKAPINPGNYVVYATSKPTNACCLECDCPAIAEMAIDLLEPTIEATIEPDEILKPFDCCPNGCNGEEPVLLLSGTAKGFPHTGNGWNVTKMLNLWIFGENKVGNYKYVNAKVPVFCDDTFEFDIASLFDYCELEPGVYDVILQHPMYNHKFDLIKEDDIHLTNPSYPLPLDENRKWMVASYPVEWSKVFPLEGPGYFQGEKALAALTEFLDAGYVDDKYVHLTFTVVDENQPHAAFSASPVSGSAPLNVQFTDESTGKDLIKWSWDFGDGATSGDVSPYHTYATEGSYTVKLTVESANGLTDDEVKSGYIKVGTPGIDADFAAYPTFGTAPLEVQFADLSTGNPNMWLWDFGDGHTAAVQNPVHTYLYGGDYTVTLTASRGSDVSVEQKADFIYVEGGPGPTPSPTVTPVPSYDEIVLYPGWNMVSTPKVLADGYDTAIIFADVSTGGHAIWQYDSFTAKWIQMEADTLVEPLYGIWIYSDVSDTVTLVFEDDPLLIPPTRDLPAGWSCIGASGSTAATARDTLTSVKEEWSQCIGFDSSLQSYEIAIINGGQGEFSDSRKMYPTKGYWLYMSGPGILGAIGA